MRWLFCMLAWAVVLPASAQHPLALTLERAISLALEHNRELVLASHKVESGTLSVAAARADFDLAVTPRVVSQIGDEERSAYGLNISKKLALGTRIRVSGEEESADGGRRTTLQVDLEQPLFRDFGRLIHSEPVVRASSDLNSLRRRYEMQKANLIVELVATFEEIIRLRHQIESDTESRDRLDALYRVTRAKEVLGRTTRVDTLRVELLRGEALNRLAIDRERLAATQGDFAELVGLPPDTEVELIPTAEIEFAAMEVAEAIRIALDNRLDYAQVWQDYEDAERGVRIARRGLLPNLILVAHAEESDESDVAEPSLFEDRPNYIGLSVETDLNFTKRRIAVNQAEISEASARESIELMELAIAREVQQVLLAHARARSELQIAERNLELASSRATLAHRLFDAGKADNFSVTDAEESLAAAENQLFGARARMIVQGYRVPHVLGTLLDVDRGLRPSTGDS